MGFAFTKIISEIRHFDNGKESTDILIDINFPLLYNGHINKSVFLSSLIIISNKINRRQIDHNLGKYQTIKQIYGGRP
jgi:hypothetical protein